MWRNEQSIIIDHRDITFQRVCLAINHTQKNIAFPDIASDLREIKSKFHDIGKIPNCVGAEDGTLIPIKGMSGTDEPAFVCRKNFHALNIQAVADARMRLVAVYST